MLPFTSHSAHSTPCVSLSSFSISVCLYGTKLSRKNSLQRCPFSSLFFVWSMYHCGDFRILSAKAVQHDYLLLLLMPICPENGFIFQSGNAQMPENIFRIFAMDKHVSIFLKIQNILKTGEMHMY